jgi:hypothetical protein
MQGQSPTIQGAMRTDMQVTGIIDCMQQIWKRDGISGFFTGTRPYFSSL